MRRVTEELLAGDECSARTKASTRHPEFDREPGPTRAQELRRVGYTTSITYHSNGQVNRVTRDNGVVDTYFKDPGSG